MWVGHGINRIRKRSRENHREDINGEKRNLRKSYICKQEATNYVKSSSREIEQHCLCRRRR